MINAYEILGVSADVGEAEIRARYLQLVREFPPDRAPERFAQIRAAYDELRDPGALLERKLFGFETTDTLESFEKDLRSRLTAGRIPSAALLSLADEV